MSRFHSSMLSGWTFTIIMVTYYNRFYVIVFVLPLVIGDTTIFTCNWFFTKLVFILKLFTAPIKQLLEILSKWPRYLNQGPAIEIWSVVHLPWALISNLALLISLPIGVNGSSNCSLSDLGLTETITSEPSLLGSI